MIDRQNEENVKQEFTNNKKNVIDNITLESPQNLYPEQLQKKKTEEGNVNNDVSAKIEEEQNLEENFRIIRARYCHEKKKVIFIMYAVRKIRNLAKLKNVFAEMTETFM
jgi:hypothetical protein